jgi:hypothetical protein
MSRFIVLASIHVNEWKTGTFLPVQIFLTARPIYYIVPREIILFVGLVVVIIFSRSLDFFLIVLATIH